MSNIGLAAIAGNAAVNSMRVQQDRNRQDERFGWEQQRNQADLSTLDARTEAVRTGAQLQAKQNTATLGLVDGETANKQTRQQIEAADLKGAQSRQPAELLARANKATVESLLSQYDVENLPRVIAQKKAAGAISDADVFVTSLSKLGDLLETDDPQAVVRYMNAMNESGALSNKHAPIASVGAEDDPKHGRVFVAKDANGNPVVKFSADILRRIRDAKSPAKFEKLDAGDSLVKIKGGQASVAVTAPESAKSTSAKQGPLERDVAYLVSTHGMTPKQALDHLNSAKTMSREQFILKSAQDTMAMSGKQLTPDQIADLGTLYDEATKRANPTPGNSGVVPAPSNSPAAPNNPKLKSLLGIP